ncbi:hypothetical protein EDEG_00609 [Edhazardia aedis USNM 41457]|uniref:Uncharacterized protein n=1 Tax=Edhazardia aedis (strain USNM 41457) TaxID=1003232 RepID=J9DCY8_EDHAE|nr:hypothetical protein EDEG_00609 [Edhazardia aedis USNM 41457]|eukprot:EJW05339.1 hypothetical protein EDEG_00609 [Edhazardia aedis USNM 41457]
MKTMNNKCKETEIDVNTNQKSVLADMQRHGMKQNLQSVEKTPNSAVQRQINEINAYNSRKHSLCDYTNGYNLNKSNVNDVAVNNMTVSQYYDKNCTNKYKIDSSYRIDFKEIAQPLKINMETNFAKGKNFNFVNNKRRVSMIPEEVSLANQKHENKQQQYARNTNAIGNFDKRETTNNTYYKPNFGNKVIEDNIRSMFSDESTCERVYRNSVQNNASCVKPVLNTKRDTSEITNLPIANDFSRNAIFDDTKNQQSYQNPSAKRGRPRKNYNFDKLSPSTDSYSAKTDSDSNSRASKFEVRRLKKYERIMYDNEDGNTCKDNTFRHLSITDTNLQASNFCNNQKYSNSYQFHNLNMNNELKNKDKFVQISGNVLENSDISNKNLKRRKCDIFSNSIENNIKFTNNDNKQEPRRSLIDYSGKPKFPSVNINQEKCKNGNLHNIDFYNYKEKANFLSTHFANQNNMQKTRNSYSHDSCDINLTKNEAEMQNQNIMQLQNIRSTINYTRMSSKSLDDCVDRISNPRKLSSFVIPKETHAKAYKSVQRLFTKSGIAGYSNNNTPNVAKNLNSPVSSSNINEIIINTQSLHSNKKVNKEKLLNYKNVNDMLMRNSYAVVSTKENEYNRHGDINNCKNNESGKFLDSNIYKKNALPSPFNSSKIHNLALNDKLYAYKGDRIVQGDNSKNLKTDFLNSEINLQRKENTNDNIRVYNQKQYNIGNAGQKNLNIDELFLNDISGKLERMNVDVRIREAAYALIMLSRERNV